MSIFRQAVNIPTVASSSANIGTFPGATAGELTLNGSLVGVNGQVSFVNMGYASSITISKGAGLSLATLTFTVVGTYNQVIVTENINGPAANASVNTDNLFHTIISISISASTLQTFNIGSNYNIAVVLPDGNSKAGLTHPNYTYSVLLNSLTAAAGQWAAGNAIIYGVSNNAPVSLRATSLTYANRPSNYFSLPVTGAALAAITQAQLQNGIIVQTTYPYAAVIVYLAAGINTTPVYIEISQS
jgi:hypothetical protein